MLVTTICLALAASLATASAKAHANQHAHHAQHARLARRQSGPAIVPANWVQQSLADPEDEVMFTLALKGEHHHTLADKMADIAQAGHGKWLSDEELAKYTAPSQKDKQTLLAHLNQHGIQNSSVTWSKYGDHATVSTTANTAGKLFNQPSLYRFNNTATGKTFVKAQSLHIPADLSSFVEHVSNLTSFHPTSAKRHIKPKPLPPATLQKLASGECDASGVTGTCLRQLYGVDDYKPSGKGKGIAVLILGFAEDYASNVSQPSHLNVLRTHADVSAH